MEREIVSAVCLSVSSLALHADYHVIADRDEFSGVFLDLENNKW